jgi:hypothetical protein
MTSVVSLCNRALSGIGTRSTIASLDEDSNEAIQCALIYEDTRDEVLQAAFWNFAQKTALLSLLKSAPGTPTNLTSTASNWTSDFPAPPWLYEYAYPSDGIQVRTIIQQIQNQYVGTPFTTGGSPIYPYSIGPGSFFEVATDLDASGAAINVILTNQYQAIARYTQRVTDPNLFGAQFAEALVQALSAKLAVPLTGKVALANTKFAQANAIIVAARASDANEGLTVIDNMPDWITCRSDDDWGPMLDQGYTAPYGPLFGAL